MPSKNEAAIMDYFKKLFTPGRNYNYDKDEEYKKYVQSIRIRESEAMNSGLDQGLSFEQISSQTGLTTDHIKNFAEKTRPGYGIGKSNVEKAKDVAGGIGGFAKDIAVDVANSFKETGQAIGQGFGGQEEQRQLDIGVDQRRKAFEQYTRDYRSGKISKERYQKLVESVGTDDITRQLDDIQSKTDPKKFVGNIAEITSLAVGGGGLANAAKQGGKRAIATAAAETAAGGALGGGGYVASNDPDSSLGDIAKGAAIGGALGLAADVGTAKFSSWLQDRKALREIAESARANKEFTSQGAEGVDDLVRQLDAQDRYIASQGITDTRRLLPDGTETKARRISEIDDELDKIRTGPGTIYKEVAPTLDNLGSTPTATNTPYTQSVDGELVVGKRGSVTPTKTVSEGNNAERARSLIREKQRLVDEIDAIRNPEVRIAEGLNLVDGDLAAAQKSGDKTALLNAERNSAYLEEQADTLVNNTQALDPSTPLPAGTKTPKAAKRLSEATGVPTDATYNTLSDVAQERAYQALKLNNPEIVSRISRGELDGRQFGLTNEYVASQVANDAIKNGDVKTIREIANGKVLSDASLKGQDISSLRALNANSPVKAVQNITKARKAASKTSKSLPPDITDMEIEQITARANKRDELKEKLLAEFESGNVSQKTRQEYGQSVVDYEKYVADRMPGQSIKDIVKNPGKAILDVAGTTKSLRATADLSATFRQGIKLLGTGKYKIWAKSTAKQLKAAVKELGGENALDQHMADIYSRENFLNGNYKRMGVAVGDVVEEAFPSKALGKVPGLRRIYSASDAAYTIFNQQARADLADDLIDKAVKAGVDITKEGKSIGALANALTSRGNLGKLEGSAADGLNKLFFSPRLLKSNIDVLGGHVVTGAGGSNFVRKEAAKNLMKIAATTYAVLTIADSVRPNSVEWDPRSSNYGKIKIGNTRFDVTGGMSSLVTLGSRLVTGSTKSSTTDIMSKLNDKENDQYSRSYADLLASFAENKLSPAARVLTDYATGEDFTGKKPTLGSTIRNLTVPITVDNYGELIKDPNAAPFVASIILDGLGLGANTYDSTDDWNVKPTAAQKAFKSSVGADSFTKANEAYNKRFTDWFREIRYTDKYKKLSSDNRRKMLREVGDDIENTVMKEYGFTYKQQSQKKDNTQDSLIQELSKFKR